jgi:hypothetical protein
MLMMMMIKREEQSLHLQSDFASQALSIETMPGDWSAPATCGDIRR